MVARRRGDVVDQHDARSPGSTRFVSASTKRDTRFTGAFAQCRSVERVVEVDTRVRGEGGIDRHPEEAALRVRARRRTQVERGGRQEDPDWTTRSRPGWVVTSRRPSGVKARAVGEATLATASSANPAGTAARACGPSRAQEGRRPGSGRGARTCRLQEEVNGVCSRASEADVMGITDRRPAAHGRLPRRARVPQRSQPRPTQKPRAGPGKPM